jgi:hypothetical protein
VSGRWKRSADLADRSLLPSQINVDMASQTTVSASDSQAAAQSSEQMDRLIDRQLRRTQRQLKFFDLAAALAQLATATLIFWLAIAIVDHWLFGLGFWMRLAALGLAVLVVAWFFVVRIIPLVVQSINPVYAARAIEQSSPSLKNSLINLLLLRPHRASIHRGVYRALEMRAASDLNQVPVDAAVDRSHLIHAGYFLAGVLAICAVYTIISPKSPFQTASRVAAPWADIARPARVTITNVEPGDARLYQGQQPTITAEIRGVRYDEPVTLLYSTADGQVVDQRLVMESGNSGFRYQCLLPPDAAGIQQDLVYRIRAGDAVTRAYQLRVSPAPTIRVEAVEYEFPAYTGRPAKTVASQGDIEALEGTRVTLRARANYPIRSATVYFDPISDDSTPSDMPETRPKRVAMKHRGDQAWYRFTLKLQPDRRTAQHASYQLEFVTESGQGSENPVLHYISVIPDLAPEIEILTPSRDRVEVMESGQQRIEIRGVDPDFGLRRLRLRAVSGGLDLLDEVVFESAEGELGQVVEEFTFTPVQLGLVAGDEVVYWAVAEDNRQAPDSTVAEANVERTPNRYLRIVPDPASKETPDATPPDAESDPGDSGGSETTEGEGGESGEQGQSSGGTEQSPTGDSSEGAGGTESSSESGESGDPQSGSEMTGNGTETGSPDAQGGDTNAAPTSEGGQSAPSNDDSGQTNTERPSSGEPSDTDGRQEPLHDGEVFERAWDRIQKEQQSAGEPSSEQETGTGEGTDPQGDEPGANGRPSSEGSPSEGERNATQRPGQEPPSPTAQSRESPSGDASQDPSRSGEGDVTGNPENPDSPKPTKQPVDGQQQGQPPVDPADRQQGPNGMSSAEDSESDAEDSANSQSRESPQPADGSSAAKTDREPQDRGDGSGNSRQLSPDSRSTSNGKEPTADPANGETTSDAPAGDSRKPRLAEGPDQQPSPDGDSGQQASEPPPGATGSGAAPSQDSGEQQGTPGRSEGQPGSEQGDSRTGGSPRSEQPPDPDSRLEVPDGESANLDYARRVTDLVLDFLDQQSENPDERLLDEMGWTPGDLQRFLQRWRDLKQGASEDAAGKRELSDALRSLGLAPERDRLRDGSRRDDGVRGLRESGLRSEPPPEYSELFRAFKKGTARQTN